MTTRFGRPCAGASRRGRVALAVLAIALASTTPALAAGSHETHVKARAHAAHVSRKAATRAKSHASAAAVDRLSLSDEFDRAELVDQMLTECRGIKYNAYELAQTTGEALMLPAPIQLMTVRVRHPYCAELLRTYAPKTRV